MSASVNRRDFLGSVAAISAGVVASASAARPQAPSRETLGPARAPDGRALKTGLIGCGGRGRGAMINHLDAAPGLQITALWPTSSPTVSRRPRATEEREGHRRPRKPMLHGI